MLCYSEEPDVVYGGSYAGDGAPGLTEVSPGVSVIADSDYPVFYSDGLYWRYDNGLWYQSNYWGGGWGYAYNVPWGVRGIRNPGAYTHWHGGANYNYGGAAIRDHRGGYNGAGFGRRGNYNGGFRSAPVRSSPGQAARVSPMRGGGGGGGFRGGGGGGFHGGGGGGHGGHR